MAEHRHTARARRVLLPALTAGILSAAFAGPAFASAVGGAALDQCANGPAATPADCSASGDWVNGDLNATKSHYAENDSVAYRLTLTGLNTATSHTVVVQWDTTKSTKHAIDYITSFDRTQTAADPCAGISGCAGPAATSPIPADASVPFAQQPGSFALYGGAITSVGPAYTASGSVADASEAIAVTFTTTVANPVLAWGGHIASHLDWGDGNAATNIPGSPYHMRLVSLDGSGGNQDRALTAAARVFPASLTVNESESPAKSAVFTFSTTGSNLSPFTLADAPAGGVSNSSTTTFTDPADFGTKTVTQAPLANWKLTGLTCTETRTQDSSTDQAAAAATVGLQEGENVICTFSNTFVPPAVVVTPPSVITVVPSVVTTPGIVGAPSKSKPAKVCASRRAFRIRVRNLHGRKLVKATVKVNGKSVAVLRGRRLTAPVVLRGLPKGTFKVDIVALTSTGVKLRGSRTYHTCIPKRPLTIPKPL